MFKGKISSSSGRMLSGDDDDDQGINSFFEQNGF